MKAIKVKYLSPTNNRGARLKASTGEKGQTIIESYDHSLGHDKHALELAYKLCERMGWDVLLNGGQLSNGTYVFTMLPRELKQGLEGIKSGLRGGATMGSLSLGYDKLKGAE